MNRQPYQTPPQWWSPNLSPRWMNFWRRPRRRMAQSQFGLSDVSVVGRHHLHAAIDSGDGVLITPNHPSHADPFIMLDAADQTATPMYFMAAWQVFHHTHRVGRRVLRQHGCFSINREGYDLPAIRQAIRILEDAQAPLVIFPEGEVFHLNDHVTAFRTGALHSAVLAAERRQAPVQIVPCGIKLQFIDDPTDALHQKLNGLEERLRLDSSAGLKLQQRVLVFGERLLENREARILGRVGRGDLQARMDQLTESILAPLEIRFGLSAGERTVPERVKYLRYHIIRAKDANDARFESAELCQALKRLFTVMQAYSYPISYIADEPSIDRLAETIEKMEEDVLGVQRASLVGRRRATVAYGSPMVINPDFRVSCSIAAETEQLRTCVQSLVDQLGGPAPVPLAVPADADAAVSLAA